MLRFTQGPPDEMQLWIACGIAAYLIVFPLVVASAAACGVLWRQAQPDGERAARTPGESHAPGSDHQRGVGAPVFTPRESGVVTAA